MPNVARAELEISMNWAERYPDFMAKKVSEWKKQFPAWEYRHTTRLERKGFINFYATKKDLTNQLG